MTQDKKIKLLIAVPIVIVTWGYILFQIIGAFGGADNTPDISLTKPVPFSIDSSIEKTSFELLPLTKDPFLGTAYTKPSQKKNTGKKRAVKKDTLIWPSIKYTGMVTDTKATSKIFMISIQGKQYLMQHGEVQEDITLLKGTADNITLRFKGTQKKFSIM